MADVKPESSEFERTARRGRPSLLGEVWGYLRANRKWWLLPVLIVLLLFGLLILFSSTGAGPFIYTLF